MNLSTPIRLCIVLFLICTISFSFARDMAITTIVVLDGKAYLVDLNDHGEITTTYMEVTNYFKSNKDHDTKVIEAKAMYRKLSKEQMDQIRFISITENGQNLDEFMLSNLEDLANHYQQTYANQIEITAARNSSNKHLLEMNIERIKSLLVNHGVMETDIKVHYKIDRGEDPTTFIKVISNLKTLPVHY